LLIWAGRDANMAVADPPADFDATLTEMGYK